MNTTTYANQNEVVLGEFVYSAMTTRGMRADQIENTAIGTIYTGVSIANLVRQATARELSKTGLIMNDKADISISGDVTTFKAADLGYTIDWTYGIAYTISRKSTSETLFSRHYTPPMMTTRKNFMSQASFVQFMHKVILSGYTLFIADPDVKAILDAPSTGHDAGQQKK